MTNQRPWLRAVAGAAVLPAAFVAFGTFATGIPFVSTAGMFVFPTFAGPWLVIALAGALLSLIVARRGNRRSGGALALMGLATAIGAGIVIARHASVAGANGVSVNLMATLVPRGGGAGATPDETRTYTEADGQPLKLDIYRPRHSSRLAPIAISIHGGGWIRGERGSKAANLRWLSDRGYVVLSLDYVLATPERATWQTASAQVACGMSWAVANAATYGGDPERVFVLGESAGGALALTTAYAAAAGVAISSCGGRVPVVRAVAAQVPAPDPVTLYENADPIAGYFSRQMVSGYLGGPPAEHPDRARAVSSATYITPGAPATLILLNDNDHLVPIAGTLQFIDRAEHAGVSVRVVRFPWADHGAANQYYSVINQAWQQLMLQHFCRYGGACD